MKTGHENRRARLDVFIKKGSAEGEPRSQTISP